jgi:arylsulfatase
MKTVPVVAALFLPFFLCGCAPESGPSGEGRDDRPNILLVMVDDMGFTDLGSYGSEIDTPNIDALARQGVRFSNFRVSISCSPTRSMLLSGTDNHLAGLGTMGELILPFQEGRPGYEGYLNDRVASLAEVLGEAGYHTYMAGKWHLGHQPGRLPADRGFERDLSLLYGGASHFADMWGLMEAETPAAYSRNGEILEALPADFYSSRSYADFLMDAVRENHGDGRPFLAYLAFTAPHDPLHVPEPWLSKYEGRYDDGYEALKSERAEGAKRAGLIPEAAELADHHPTVRPWESLSDRDREWERANMEAYAGMLANMDYHLGRVVTFLEDVGEYDNTFVIFLSDNGPNPWYSEQYPGNKESGFLDQFDNSAGNIGNPNSNSAYGIGWATASSGPLSLFKMAVAEGGIRAPLIISGPGVEGAGRVSGAFSYVWDLMPTILDIARVRHPAEVGDSSLFPMKGRSMAGVLSGESETVYEAGALIAGEMGGGRWISDGTHKAVLVAHPYGDGLWELYNIAEDPGESRNIAEANPDLLERLVAAWDEYAADVGVVFPPSGEEPQ